MLIRLGRIAINWNPEPYYPVDPWYEHLHPYKGYHAFYFGRLSIKYRRTPWDMNRSPIELLLPMEEDHD